MHKLILTILALAGFGHAVFAGDIEDCKNSKLKSDKRIAACDRVLLKEFRNADAYYNRRLAYLMPRSMARMRTPIDWWQAPI